MALAYIDENANVVATPKFRSRRDQLSCFSAFGLLNACNAIAKIPTTLRSRKSMTKNNTALKKMSRLEFLVFGHGKQRSPNTTTSAPHWWWEW